MKNTKWSTEEAIIEFVTIEYPYLEVLEIGELKGCATQLTIHDTINNLVKHPTVNTLVRYLNPSSRLRQTWNNMQVRLSNSDCASYNHYHTKGITCEWDSFEEFYADMIDSYLAHIEQYGIFGATLDRINNSGNYSKNNCRWANYKQQAQNKGNNEQLSFDI